MINFLNNIYLIFLFICLVNTIKHALVFYINYKTEKSYVVDNQEITLLIISLGVVLSSIFIGFKLF